jgi:hypothetical protein
MVWMDSLEPLAAAEVAVVKAVAGHTGSHKGMFRTLFLYLPPEAPMFGPTSLIG